MGILGPMTLPEPTYKSLGERVGALVDVKNKAYGSAFDDAGAFLKILYPTGIQPHQYSDALALVRIFDKMKRIAVDKDALGESPYQDIAGYGLLGLRRVERERAATIPPGESIEPLEETPEVTVEPPAEEIPKALETLKDRLELRGLDGFISIGGGRAEQAWLGSVPGTMLPNATPITRNEK